MASISALGIGSGLDLNGLLDQLETAEREKLAPIITQKNSYEAKISAYGKLTSVLDQFKASVAKLSGPDLFQGVKATLSGTAITAEPGVTTPEGSYQLEVTALARAYSLATAGIADDEISLGAGNITLTLANGQNTVVQISEENSTLTAIRDAINASDAGVVASIVNDGSATPFRLVLSSENTGSDAAISNIDFGDISTSLITDPTTEVLAQNASLTVNGITITSQTNSIEGAIQGASLSLVEEGIATVVFERDEDAIVTAVDGFVKAYNKVQETVAKFTSYDTETGVAGDLLGDATLRSVQSRLRAVLTGGVEEGLFKNLTDLGVTLELGGSLKLDKAALKETIASQGQALGEFFAGTSSAQEQGLADKLVARLEQALKTPGQLKNATSAMETNIKRLDERYSRVEQGIDATIARYRTQFGQLDSLIATMNSTSAYLSQQFEVMNAQLNA